MLDYLSFEKACLRLYQEGLTVGEICAVLDEKRDRCYKLLNKHHLKPHKTYRTMSKKDIDLICKEYSEGKTIQKIADSYPSYSSGAVNYWLRKKGMTRKNGVAAHLNHDYFEDVNSPDKAYFLGILFADGSVFLEPKHGDSWRIRLELQEQDKYIIERFLIAVESSVSVHHCGGETHSTQHGKEYRFFKNNTYAALHSTKMAHDLILLGCVPNKSKELLYFPNISEALQKYFILGFFDGDGIVSYGTKSRYIGFCGQRQMLEKIRTYLTDSVAMTDAKIYYNRFNGIYYLQYGKIDDIQKFFEYFYSPETFCMARKRQKIEKMINDSMIIPR